ncbi:Clp protease N-terminal domain-containing protein [Streptomyces sp. NPDC004610]|uniref:Clp protease N-terminal domain-containing protein n=1 Tax=unclassified Streptomyces TaxID=2593676 RepID=UPI0033B237EB
MRNTTDRATAASGAATELAPDVMTLLVAALRRAVRGESDVVGTDTLLEQVALGGTDVSDAVAPGIRESGALGGRIRAQAGRGWVSADDSDSGSGSDTVVRRSEDEWETDAAWREARWRHTLAARGAEAGPGRELPGMSGALRDCLLTALGAARAEGSLSVRPRHVARALLAPGTRAHEAMTLERLDPAATATALDALDTRAADARVTRTDTARPESGGVTLLRRAGVFGGGSALTRAFTSWTAGSTVNGSPVVMAVGTEAIRQAIRSGHAAAERVDLLLGILALDRAMHVAGYEFPAPLAEVNSAAGLLRGHGVDQASLAQVVRSVPSGVGAEGGPGVLTGAAERVVAVARLIAAESGSPTVGTVHLLAALLDDRSAAEGGEEPGPRAGIAALLSATGADLAALRADLSRHRAA